MFWCIFACIYQDKEWYDYKSSSVHCTLRIQHTRGFLFHVSPLRKTHTWFELEITTDRWWRNKSRRRTRPITKTARFQTGENHFWIFTGGKNWGQRSDYQLQQRQWFIIQDWWKWQQINLLFKFRHTITMLMKTSTASLSQTIMTQISSKFQIKATLIHPVMMMWIKIMTII